jgi:group II intron reverse transcriptase/maturase
VLDADIRGFFDTLDHGWLVKFIEHRVADRRVVRLIQKWLKAGVLEDGKRSESEVGTVQGGSISPLLANIYLHYVFDLWVQHWRKTKAKGDVIVVRWADDFVVGFQHQSDALRFHQELAERFARFKLKLHPEKTRVIEFGFYAAHNRKRRGQGKPETFNGMFTVLRRTMSKRKRAKLREVKTELRKRMHHRVAEVGKWLRSVVEGHNRYYGVPSNLPSLSSFRFHVTRDWYRSLRRRSQLSRLTWEQMYRLTNRWLPPPTLHHPYPLRRLGVIT